jgi:hypothetical protein
MAEIQPTTTTTPNPSSDRKEAVGKNTKWNGKLLGPPLKGREHWTPKYERTEGPRMDISRHINTKWIKPPVFSLCLAPLANLAWKSLSRCARANPIEVLTHSTGTWTLGFLCVTLSMTPLRFLLYQNWLVCFRRMFGLFAFFYGCLHLAI